MKIGILKVYKNGCFKSNVIEFEANGEMFKRAALYLINQNEEYKDCFLFDPETLSPITFDFTYYIKSKVVEGENLPCDNFTLTYNDMIERLEEVTKRDDIFNKTIHPFCRTIYSHAGKLGEFLNMHAGLNINLNNQVSESIFIGKQFDQLTITNNLNKV